MRSLIVNYPRKNFLFTILCVSTLSLLTGVQSSFAKPPSMEEMWEIIQQQQQVIADLKERLDDTDQRVTVNEEKTEETAEEIEAAAEAFETAQTSSGGSSWADRTSIGGYGELHYNNLSDDNDTVGGDNSLDRVDFPSFRFVFRP